MKQKYICVWTWAVFGAVSAYSQITLNPVPERAVGTPQLAVTSYTPNLVEGREFYSPQAVALDNSVSPPILYVSDYVNNRVLAWKNAATFTTGQFADLVIGQPNAQTTFPAGPSAVAQRTSTYSTGLARPSGLAVDKNGNLYVADGGNNRVLRYPTPFAQTGQFPVPDLWIGQLSVSGYGPNYPGGTQTPTAQGLLLSAGNTVPSSLAFDSGGNLWVLDTGNVRVLRFNASSLAGTGGGLTADIELGQPSLTSNSPALYSGSAASFYNLTQFIAPTAIAFDPSGNLFVADLNRVLVFPGPTFTSGMSASSHILGIFPTGYTFPTTPAATQALLDQTTVYGPTGFFFLTGGTPAVGVVDAGYNRIMIFPSFANWPASGAPPTATSILGQPNACAQSANQTCKAANNGNPQPSNSVFASPGGAAYTGTDLYLVDTGNNRVLDLPQQGGSFGAATRVLGQDYFTTNSPNLIEGREFQFSGAIGGNVYSDAGIAIDNTTSTPHLYVADPYNNRVLGFKDLRQFQNGAKNKADIVLGQKDFTTALVNYPSGSPNSPTSSSLYRPVGLLVDAQGNLYVADSFNGRIMRFPAPFAYTGTAPEPADLVLGQQNFTSTIKDPTNTNMAIPYGLAFTPSCNLLTQPCQPPNALLVSDQYDNRVLYIPTTANGTFVAGTDNGKTATIVLGQANFNAIGTGNGLAAMNSPHHISCDTNGYVYVADTGNNRVLIFPDPHAAGTPATGQLASASITGLNSPSGVFANPVTGEIWIANTGAGQSLRYANYQSVLFALGSSSNIPEVSGSFDYHPLAAAQDEYGNLFVADDAHRVAIYYSGLNVCNGASFLPNSLPSQQYPSANCLPNYDTALRLANDVLPPRALAPGVIATIFPCDTCTGTQFLQSQNVFSSYPVPKSLGDVEVLVNQVPAPLYIVYPGQINFIVPNATPASGTADLEVIQVSTGQILGAAQVPMAPVAPGAFLYPGGQSGATVYAAAINQDGTINSASNPALRGSVTSLYLTGEGFVPGAPADGVPATSAISAQYPVTVLLNGIDVNSPSYGEQSIQHVLYSGINQYPGMWQINVQIPQTVVTTSGVWFAVIADGTANWDATSPFKTYIYVK
jgi:uncharacterized protein (TIGR03437 family)